MVDALQLAALAELGCGGILARDECETRYADIECVRHGCGPANPSADANGALCVVCEVGWRKVSIGSARRKKGRA